MNALQYQSLAAFVGGTKGMTQDKAYQLAKAEFAILADWIEKTPAAQKYRRPPEIERWIDYFADLRKLLHHCENGYSSASGYTAQLIQAALKQWENNATQSSKEGLGNRK